jgi:hypothetical protein
VERIRNVGLLQVCPSTTHRDTCRRPRGLVRLGRFGGNVDHALDRPLVAVTVPGPDGGRRILVIWRKRKTRSAIGRRHRVAAATLCRHVPIGRGTPIRRATSSRRSVSLSNRRLATVGERHLRRSCRSRTSTRCRSRNSRTRSSTRRLTRLCTSPAIRGDGARQRTVGRRKATSPCSTLGRPALAPRGSRRLACRAADAQRPQKPGAGGSDRTVRWPACRLTVAPC